MKKEKLDCYKIINVFCLANDIDFINIRKLKLKHNGNKLCFVTLDKENLNIIFYDSEKNPVNSDVLSNDFLGAVGEYCLYLMNKKTVKALREVISKIGTSVVYLEYLPCYWCVFCYGFLVRCDIDTVMLDENNNICIEYCGVMVDLCTVTSASKICDVMQIMDAICDCCEGYDYE